MPLAAFEALLSSLEVADVANVRQFQDSIALVLLRRVPRLLRARMLPLLHDCRTSGSHAVSSLILIAARAAVAQLEEGQPAGAVPGDGAAGDGTAAEGAARQGLEGQPAGQAAERRLSLEQRELLGAVVQAVAPWALSHVHAIRCDAFFFAA